MPTPEERRRQLLETAQAHFLTLRDSDRWIEIWPDDGELEFPYAPPGRTNGVMADWLAATASDALVDPTHPPAPLVTQRDPRSNQ